MRAVVGAAADLCCVAAFVAIGRASHAEGETVAGLARTLWPFVAGLAAGWAVTRAWRSPRALMPAGAGVWLCTVALGMVLRVVSGQGIAVAFVFVTLAFLGLFMLGWRVLTGIFGGLDNKRRLLDLEQRVSKGRAGLQHRCKPKS